MTQITLEATYRGLSDVTREAVTYTFKISNSDTTVVFKAGEEVTDNRMWVDFFSPLRDELEAVGLELKIANHALPNISVEPLQNVILGGVGVWDNAYAQNFHGDLVAERAKFVNFVKKTNQLLEKLSTIEKVENTHVNERII